MDEMMIEDKAAFDMGFSTLTRVNFWLWKCNIAENADNAPDWYKCCKTLFKEADVFMSDKEVEEHENIMKQTEEAYRRYIIHRNNSKGKTAPPKEIYDKLFNWERKLRRILDKKGLLMRKGERADMAML